MLRSREYRQRIAFKKTIEDALYIDAPDQMRQLFAEMAAASDAPEFLSDFTPATLDALYEQYAPEKWLSKTGALVYSDVDGVLTHVGSLSQLAAVINATYGYNWNRLYEAYTSEYNPIENYNMVQKATYNSAEGITGTDSNTKLGSESTTHSGTDSITKSGTESTSHSGTDSTTKGGTESTSHSGTDSTTKGGTESIAHTGTDTNTKGGTESTTHTGTDGMVIGGTESKTKLGSEQLEKAGSESTVYNSRAEELVSAFNSTTYQPASLSLKDSVSGSGGRNADAVTYGIDASGNSDVRSDTTNYDLTETTNTDRTETRNIDTADAVNYDVTDTRNIDTSDVTNFDVTDTRNLNTSDVTNFDVIDTRNLNTSDVTNYGVTDTHNINNSDVLNINVSDTLNVNRTNSHTGYDELTRSGNIGVTTSAQMVEGELKLRQYNFIMQVFRDVTDLLGLPIY